MSRILTYIGGAGVGKTTTLLDTMGKLIDQGRVTPREIGFVSFTRAARSEAAARAADRFALAPKDLERDGWFRTVHSVCYRQLAVGDRLLAPGKATAEWLQEHLGDDVSATGEDDPDKDFGASATQDEQRPGDRALRIWHLARNRLVPVRTIHDRLQAVDPQTPDWEVCERVIGRYERAKRLDNRVDFTDLLGQFAGLSFQVSGVLEVSTQGEVPEVPIWFLDEAQDNTALIDAVLRRLTESAEIVYLVGDPFQAIHEWAGADARLFQAWPAEKSRVLNKSYRCLANILALGETCLLPCSNYWDRGIQPAGPGGEVYGVDSHGEWLAELSPLDSWLLLARTNYQARRLMAILRGSGIPWVPIKGNGGWAAPLRNAATAALLSLSRGGTADVAGWQAVTKIVPSKVNGVELLARGTKSAWEHRDKEAAEPVVVEQEEQTFDMGSWGSFSIPASPAEAIEPQAETRTLADLEDWGATEFMRQRISDGRWVEWIDHAAEFVAAIDKWGPAGVFDSQIRIGTIHSAKGMEADNVVILTTTSRMVYEGSQDQEGIDAESRLKYVAVTRARRRVILANEMRARYRMEFPA